MEGFLVLAGLVVLAVPVLLVVALVSLGNLKGRVGELERALERLRAERVAPGRPAATAATPVPLAATPAPVAPVSDRVAMAAATAVPAAAPGTASAAGARIPPPPPTRPAEAHVPPPAAPSPPDYLQRATALVKRWFTEGNVPVKVGMLVLLAGVAALLKYASDQGWLTLPLGLRLAAVALVAVAALAFAWRQRERHRSFALAVQGGAIGVLLLVVFAAGKLYGMVPLEAAFALSVVLVAALGVLAVLQDSRSLAILGILAGFLAPIWLADGSGNHVVLFAYYALLNTAIFAIAWLRPWRELNLLGFVFTWGIGVAWGVLAYDPAKFATTEPFLLLFFVFYLLLPILYARRRPAARRDRIDGSLVFGTPLVAFALQAVLLDGERNPLALCALVLAVVYALLAWWLRRGPGAVLGEAYALLAGGFATLAVPLALSARATASVFALEGAALVWLGLRQQRRFPMWAGAGLQVAAAAAFFIGIDAMPVETRAIANPTFMGALLIALAGFASAWWCRGGDRTLPAALFYGWGLAWWCGNAVREIGTHLESSRQADALLVLVAVTAWLAGEAHRRRPAAALVLTVLAAMALAIPLAFAQATAHGHPFAWPGGLVAWLLFAACGARALACLRVDGGPPAGWAQFAWWLAWAVAVTLLATHAAGHFSLGDGWRLALAAAPWLALAGAAHARWNWLRPPLGAAFDALRAAFTGTLFALLGVGWLVALRDAGGSAPLPWMPVLNPLDLAQLATLLLFAHWLRTGPAPDALARLRTPLLAAAGFLLATCITLRAVHHWGGVPWDDTLWASMLAQTSLTVVWSLLGVAGWIAGSRRGQRALWLAGAVLMALVLAKLVLVDRQHLGNLLGIGSFMAYGLLCTLVGWFAPAPPRGAAPEAEAMEAA